MPTDVELFTAYRTVEDPARPADGWPGRSFGAFLDAEYYPIQAESFAGLNGLTHRREACPSPTLVVEIPDGADLVVEWLEGRASVWEVALHSRRYVDADELLKLARRGWRGLRVFESGAEVEVEAFTLCEGRA